MRLILRVDKDFYCAGRVGGIGLQKIRGKAELLKALLGIVTQPVRANAAGDDAVITKETGDVGEVSWGSAKLLAGRKEVPEQFTQTDDGEISV